MDVVEVWEVDGLGEVLEQGPEPKPHRPGPWAALALVAALVAVAFVTVRQDDSRSAEPDPQRPSPVPAPVASTRLPTWPTALGACGSSVFVPLVSAPALDEPTGLQLLMGGDGLRTVALDTGRTRTVSPPLATFNVTAVDVTAVDVTAVAVTAVAGGSEVYALGLQCLGPSRSSTTVTALDPTLQHARSPDPSRADVLVGGSGGVWGWAYPPSDNDPVVLRRLDGPGAGRAPAVTLPAGFRPLVSTPGGFVGAYERVLLLDGTVPRIAVVSARTGRVGPTLARGFLMGADRHTVLVSSPCARTTPCRVSYGSLTGGGMHAVALPAGRVPASRAVFDPSGRTAAFQLARASSSTRYSPGGDEPSSDIAVLDVPTGSLTVLPGVELAPDYVAALAFSADGRWLIVSLGEGGRTQVLVWRRGLDGLRATKVQIGGPVLYSPPVADAQALGTRVE